MTRPWLSLAATRAAALALLLALAGCAAIPTVSAYDAATDQAVSALQRKTEAHFIALEGVAGRKPECSHARHKPFYDEAKVDASAIAVRAAALPQNELTTEQARLLASSLDTLEKLHRLSECLSAEQIQPLRIQFNTMYTAILKLELAKKRTP